MKCKVGDLAIIIDSSWEANIGGLVEVLALEQSEPGLWVVRALQPLMAQEDEPPFLVRLAPAGDIGAIYDECLQPLRGPRQADPVHALIEEAAGA